MAAKTKQVTLKWFIAYCPVRDCGWEGNPTPDEQHAKDQARDHDAQVHAPEAE